MFLSRHLRALSVLKILGSRGLSAKKKLLKTFKKKTYFSFHRQERDGIIFTLNLKRWWKKGTRILDGVARLRTAANVAGGCRLKVLQGRRACVHDMIPPNGTTVLRAGQGTAGFRGHMICLWIS